MNIKNICNEKEFLRKYYAVMGSRGGNGFRKYSSKKGAGGQRRKKSWLISMMSRSDNATVLEENLT